MPELEDFLRRAVSDCVNGSSGPPLAHVQPAPQKAPLPARGRDLVNFRALNRGLELLHSRGVVVSFSDFEEAVGLVAYLADRGRTGR